MAEVKWIKLNIDMFDNRKIKYLRRLPEGNNIVLIWVMLLTIAGRCNSGGMIFLTENIPYNLNMLADELGFEPSTVKLAIDALETLGMVTRDESQFLITGWAEHQNVDGMERAKEMNRNRVAAYRERKRLLDGNVTCNVTVTDCNAVEEDIENKSIELRKEKKKEEREGDSDIDRNGTEPQAPPVLTFLLNDGSEFPFYQDYIDQMQELYPAVDVLQEMKQMKAWCINNPKKRKTRRGVNAFVNNWLSSEQDKGGRKRQQPTPGRQSTTFMDIYERRHLQNDS